MAQLKRTNVSAPPGSGKTRLATRLAVAAALRDGPQSVAAVTYTKAAALELQERMALALGIKDHSQRNLSRQIPYVGTLHSLAYRLLHIGKGQVAGEHLADFCGYVNIPPPRDRYASVDDLEGLWWGGLDASSTEIDSLLRVLASMRHTGRSIEDAYERIPMARQLVTNPGRMAWLAQEYNLWKHEHDYLDFEDMLEQGCTVPIPCKTIINDEVQDQSLLMWRVVNAWAEGGRCEHFWALGDGFQSLYQWAGASPDLFFSQPGEWFHLPVSHRLGNDSAQYARAILQRAGYESVPEWRGVGGQPVDGTTFYLARTHALVGLFEGELQRDGTPYKSLRGSSPWSSRAGQAFRACRLVERTGWVMPADALKNVVKQIRLPLPRRAKAAVEGMGGEVSWPEELFGGLTPTKAADYFQHSDYFQRVEAVHGAEAIFEKPKISVSTIHGAKGREADRVILADSWAQLPARMLANEEGRLAEACVAYVACTRHRASLEIKDDFPGHLYPLP